MQWFGRAGDGGFSKGVSSNGTQVGITAKGGELTSSMPETNFQMNDFERIAWMTFCDICRHDSGRVVKWEKLDPGFYKASLGNGDVIFYIEGRNEARYLKESEARFDTEKTWQREFSRRLNYTMERTNTNQLLLSEKTGISKSSLSYYLNCKRVPSAYTVRCLADALNTTVEFLSGF